MVDGGLAKKIDLLLLDSSSGGRGREDNRDGEGWKGAWGMSTIVGRDKGFPFFVFWIDKAKVHTGHWLARFPQNLQTLNEKHFKRLPAGKCLTTKLTNRRGVDFPTGESSHDGSGERGVTTSASPSAA